MQSQFNLFKNRRFVPLFIVQFFQAFNDNVFKNAMVLLITYVLAHNAHDGQLMVTIAAGIYIVPFFLFSATAGQLADRYDKTILTRIIKFFELALMIIGTFGFYTQNKEFLMVTLFLMGTHSTFFGPIKYAILPNLVKTDELIGGNALVESSTFIAILIGTIIGGIFIVTKAGVAIIGALTITSALVGLISSFYMPKIPGDETVGQINNNFIQETFSVIKQCRKLPYVFLAILGISWFWLIGATFLSQLPVFTKEIIHGDANIVSFYFALFSIGIGAGSLLCNKLVRGKISAKFSPIALLLLSLFVFDFCYNSGRAVAHHGKDLLGLNHYFDNINNWRIALDLFLLAVCGGIYIVPLYAIIQIDTPESFRSRAIGCNNILNALFMVISAVGVLLLMAIQLSILHVFVVLGIVNVVAALYFCKLLPRKLVVSVIKWLLKFFFHVRVKGLKNYLKVKGNALIIANHTSLLDVAVLSCFLPKPLTFAINSDMARQRWLQPFLKLADTFCVDPTNPMALKSLIKRVEQGDHVVIFPEGRITVTGALMKIYEGPGVIADKAKAQIIPIRIEGAQYSKLSYMRHKIKMRWFPKVTMTIMPAQHIPETNNRGRARRHFMSEYMYRLMTDNVLESANTNQTLFQSLLDAKHIYGGHKKVVEDINRTPLSYKTFILKSLVLGDKIASQTKRKEHVGLMLPNTIATAVTFFAMQAFGRIPTMINFTAGHRNIVSACNTTVVKQIYTSQKFIEAAKLQELVEELKVAGIKIHYLEELKDDIGAIDKVKGLWRATFANWWYHKLEKQISADETAVILFTSGSEGAPKGVALSHRNIQYNRYQMGAFIDFNSSDVMFNALPMFHCFGLTVGTILPLLDGIKTFFYPSPLHYRIIPELIYDVNATLLFGTDTFLNGYAKFAHPYDFYSVRYLFAGAEKLKPQTRRLWADRFGVRVFEGYGVTETAPVLCVNTPMHNKPGTVGQFVPGVEYKLQPVEGVAQGGRLLVRGPNIMKGYFSSEKPGHLVPPSEGFHDTGDIVDVDSDGYVKILGRAKRFAKIGGEMVSLLAVEQYVQELWPENLNAVICQHDDKKGEKLILFTDNPNAKLEDLVKFAKGHNIAAIQIPKAIEVLEEMPVLATGKIDYVELGSPH